MHVSVLVYPLIIFEFSGLFQSSVMKSQSFRTIWVLTNFLKNMGPDEQKNVDVAQLRESCSMNLHLMRPQRLHRGESCNK